MMMIPPTILVLVFSLCAVVNGFSPSPCTIRHISSSRNNSLYAGFGGGGDASMKKKKIELKPKQQWDRYIEMKKETKIAVGVKLIEDTDTDEKEWLEVGFIKSFESKYTRQAVFRQRQIIAAHAARLYPLRITGKKKLQWGYEQENGDGEWTVVDKSCDTGGEGLDTKLIGFQGLPDKGGFYSSHRVTSNPMSLLGLENSSPKSGNVKGSKKKGPGDGVI